MRLCIYMDVRLSRRPCHPTQGRRPAALRQAASHGPSRPDLCRFLGTRQPRVDDLDWRVPRNRHLDHCAFRHRRCAATNQLRHGRGRAAGPREGSSWSERSCGNTVLWQMRQHNSIGFNRQHSNTTHARQGSQARPARFSSTPGKVLKHAQQGSQAYADTIKHNNTTHARQGSQARPARFSSVRGQVPKHTRIPSRWRQASVPSSSGLEQPCTGPPVGGPVQCRGVLRLSVFG